MVYYKVIQDEYITMVGTGSQGTEITETEYNDILNIIHNKPTAQDGHGYKLTESLEWELYELPIKDNDPEISETEALEIILGGAYETK